MQAQLLRVLQEGEIRRVGGERSDPRRRARRRGDAPRPGQPRSRQGRFREDLLYRLQVLRDPAAAAARARPGTSRCWSSTSSAQDRRRARARRRPSCARAVMERCSSATPGPATSASWRTRCSAWSCWPATDRSRPSASSRTATCADVAGTPARRGAGLLAGTHRGADRSARRCSATEGNRTRAAQTARHLPRHDLPQDQGVRFELAASRWSTVSGSAVPNRHRDNADRTGMPRLALVSPGRHR